MAYTVNTTREFNQWFKGLTAAERESFAVAVNLLKEKGPLLGRPYADTLKGSAHRNMKELRMAHKSDIALRAAFAFDPARAAILLIGGDKHSARGFYRKLIKQADDLFSAHLALIKQRQGAPNP